MKRYIFLLLCCLVAAAASVVFADDAEIEAQADEIRLDENYVYAETFYAQDAGLDDDLVTQRALRELAVSVNAMRAEKGKPALNVEVLYPLVDIKKYFDGHNQCMFVYIPVEKAVNFNASAIDRVDAGQYSAAGHGDAAAAAPASPSAASSVAVDAAGNVSATDSVMVENVGACEVVSMDTVAVSAAVVVEVAGTPETRNVAMSIVSADELTLADLGNLLLTCQQEGKITEFGQASSLADIPEGSFFAVVDRSLRMQAAYGPFSDGSVKNLKTSEPVDENALENCGLVWFH